MKIRRNPDTLIGFDNAVRHAVEVACNDPTKTVCSVLKEICGCTVISTIDDPESLNSGYSLIDKEASQMQHNFNFYSGILLGYITSVEFASEEDLVMFTLKWA